MQLDASEQEAAVASFRSVLAWTEATHGPDHGSTAAALRNVGLALYASDRPEEAARHIRRALSIREHELGDSHPDVAACTDLLFGVEHALGHEAAALEYARRSVAIYESVHGPDHLDTINARMRLGSALESVDPEGALESMRTAIDALTRVAGRGHPHVATAMFNLAQVELRLERNADALVSAREAYEQLRTLHGEDDVRTVGATIAIGSALRHLGRLDEARPWLVDALARSQPAPPGRRAAASDALGRLEYDVGDLPRAAALFDAGAEAWAEAYGPDHREAEASRNDAATIRTEMARAAR